MKIIELRAENVKRLSAVQVTPEGSLVVVGGKNGAGKSSLLDSIVYALSGAASLPGKPVRKGEEHAEIELTLDSEPPIVVRRRIRDDGKTDLEIKQLDANGKATAKVTSPQKLLDSWLIYSREHEAWWAPNSRGYTIFEENAGRYGKVEAFRICQGAGADANGSCHEFMYPAPECVVESDETT